VRSFIYQGSLFLTAIKDLVSFLVRGVSVSNYTPLKFNKVSPLLSWMYTWTVWSVKPRYIVCWLSILQNIFFLLFFFSLLVNLVLFSLRRPSD